MCVWVCVCIYIYIYIYIYIKLYYTSLKDLTEKVTFEQRPEGGKGAKLYRYKKEEPSRKRKTEV